MAGSGRSPYFIPGKIPQSPLCAAGGLFSATHVVCGVVRSGVEPEIFRLASLAVFGECLGDNALVDKASGEKTMTSKASERE